MIGQKLGIVFKLFVYSFAFPAMIISFVHYDYLGLPANVFIWLCLMASAFYEMTLIKKAIAAY
ncbi:hypothetical protein [Rufibacter sp. LB8]|uniref:hypothetical protein n=1 Tax=Rufibacter sp. LB8 TaxID=2777781 RepID=UPI00178C5099|nr:hypothetical protein [Rufibacter sp. LB8]